jgi:hypothetical protein
MASRPACLGVKPHLGPKTRFLLLSDSCGFVDVGRPLVREDGYVVYNCCWASPTQSFFGPSPAGLMTIFYCLIFETPSTCRARSPYLYPPGTGRPVYTPRHCVLSSSRPTTSRATVEVFGPVVTRNSPNKNRNISPHYIDPARTTQKTSLPLLRVLSLPGNQLVHRAVP